MKLNARELRDLEEKKAKGEMGEVRRNPIYFILENIYDTYNIGGLFRLADALAVEKIYLCGQMETPPNHKIKKASIGTYKVVNWKYCKTAKEAIDDLKNPKSEIPSSKQIINSNTQNSKRLGFGNSKLSGASNLEFRISMIAVEQSPKSIPYTQADYQFPLALIFGNETYGVLPETLDKVDQIVEIPMWGINKSLNVIVSAAIVSYFAVSKWAHLVGK